MTDPDKVYWYEQRSGMRRKVAKILDMQAAEIDPHIKEKGDEECEIGRASCRERV